jgi:hypothetical protein
MPITTASSSAGHGGPAYPTFLVFNDTYYYDGLNRLVAADDRDVNNVDLWSHIFGYDRYGNMSVSVNGGVPLYGTTPTSSTNFNASTRLISGATFDAAGNHTEVGSYSLAYDAEKPADHSCGQCFREPGESGLAGTVAGKLTDKLIPFQTLGKKSSY